MPKKTEEVKKLPILDTLVSTPTPPNTSALWNIRAPLQKREAQIRKVRDALEEEHRYSLEQDAFSAVDAGVILGALSLVAGLLGSDD